MAKANILFKRVAKNGALNIPVKLRREMGIQAGDAMELQVTEDNKIVVTSYQLRCCFCESDKDILNFNGKGICKECGKKIKERFGGNGEHGIEEHE